MTRGAFNRLRVKREDSREFICPSIVIIRGGYGFESTRHRKLEDEHPGEWGGKFPARPPQNAMVRRLQARDRTTLPFHCRGA